MSGYRSDDTSSPSPPRVDWRLVVDGWDPLEGGAPAGEWIVEPGTFPAFLFSEHLMAFHRSLVEAGVMVPFDWPRWFEDEGRSIEETPGGIESADLESLRRLLVAHVRSDRFSEGHLAAMIESGRIGRIVARVRELIASDGATDRMPG